MNQGKIIPLYPSQERRAAELARRIGTDRQMFLEFLAAWRRQQLLEIARRQAARKRAS